LSKKGIFLSVLGLMAADAWEIFKKTPVAQKRQKSDSGAKTETIGRIPTYFCHNPQVSKTVKGSTRQSWQQMLHPDITIACRRVLLLFRAIGVPRRSVRDIVNRLF
jgi:hypothetical protein